MLNRLGNLHARSGKQPRGFVVIIVLLVLVVVTTIVVGQLDTATHELVVGVRAEEEVKARGAAEGCLALMTRYAETYMNTGCATPPCKPDFDELLDRDNNQAESAGDYLPSLGAATVTVTGSGAQRSWKFIDRGNNTACLVRFDDNSDDSAPTSGFPVGSTDVAGPESDAVRLVNNLRDVPFLDRDRAVFISAIGLFPVRSGSANAYRNAHARVTLRRLLAVSNPQVTGGAGVVANAIDVNNNAALCGVGGMTANDIDVGSNGCYCGSVTTDNLSGTIGTAGCGRCNSCNATTTTDPGAPIPPPTVEVPAWSNNFMHAEGWGAPIDYDTPTPNPTTTGPLTDGGETPFPGAPPAPSALSGPHDPTVCSFRGKYVGTDAHVFVWDAKDPDAVVDLVTNKGVSSLLLGGLAAVVGTDVRNCTVSPLLAGNLVPDACTWNPSTNTVDCAAGQSPCWKLIAVLGDGSANDADIGIGAAIAPEQTANSSEGFAPQIGVDIPNVRGSRRWAVSAADPTHLCGLPPTGGDMNYCAGCNGTNILFEGGNDHFHFEDGGGSQSRITTLPGPAIFALTNVAGNRVHLKSGGSFSAPLHMTILSDQRIEIDNGLRACGARLLCENVTAAFNQAEADAVHRFPPIAPETMGHSRGFLMKSPDLCEIGNSTDIWGDMRCGTVRTNNSFRLVGNIGAYDNSVAGGGTAGPCNTGGTCSDAHLCMNNTPTIVGNIAVVGDAELNNSGTISGRMFVDGSICGNNNFVLTGALMATGEFEVNNNLLINVDPTMVVGTSPTFFSPGATSYMEGAW